MTAGSGAGQERGRGGPSGEGRGRPSEAITDTFPSPVTPNLDTAAVLVGEKCSQMDRRFTKVPIISPSCSVVSRNQADFPAIGTFLSLVLCFVSRCDLRRSDHPHSHHGHMFLARGRGSTPGQWSFSVLGSPEFLAPYVSLAFARASARMSRLRFWSITPSYIPDIGKLAPRPSARTPVFGHPVTRSHAA